jgi:membrane protein required for colicin V production
MNYIDIIILAIMVWSLFRGFKNGFIIELASVAALILGIWGAIRFSGFTQAKLMDFFDMQTEYIGLISFILTFIGIVILVHLLARILDKLMKAVALGLLIRLLGILFAIVKSVLILSILFVILNTIDQRAKFLPDEKINGSMLYNPISDIAPMIFPIIEGGDLRKSFDRFRKEKPAKITPEEILI